VATGPLDSPSAAEVFVSLGEAAPRSWSSRQSCNRLFPTVPASGPDYWPARTWSGARSSVRILWTDPDKPNSRMIGIDFRETDIVVKNEVLIQGPCCCGIRSTAS
jgi:hypothetical protein